MESDQVSKLIQEEIDEHFVFKVCPKCKTNTKFIKFELYSEGIVLKLRCMNCLTLFTETLEEES